MTNLDDTFDQLRAWARASEDAVELLGDILATLGHHANYPKLVTEFSVLAALLPRWGKRYAAIKEKTL